MASNGPAWPACGSFARLKLRAQLAPPLVVEKTSPCRLESVTKHELALGQLIPLRLLVVTGGGSLHETPPLVVVAKLPFTPMA
jgi:hypothetical protein